ncbi:MAG: MAPEG family protein [Rhizobiales bacterium]|nr:MAPEG family protein [Hyphomicrobiales bacterium]
MSLIITPFYAGLLALFYFYLTIQVVKQRRENRVSIGAGKNRLLERAMRVHGNFSEYAPIALLLIAFAELLGTPSWSIHALALALIAGRLLHAYGLGQEPDNLKFRRWGMYLTAGVIICAAITCIVLSGQAMIAGI